MIASEAVNRARREGWDFGEPNMHLALADQMAEWGVPPNDCALMREWRCWLSPRKIATSYGPIWHWWTTDGLYGYVDLWRGPGFLSHVAGRQDEDSDIEGKGYFPEQAVVELLARMGRVPDCHGPLTAVNKPWRW